MSIAGSISTIQFINTPSTANTLQAGSNVFVRVLSKGQGGEYTVSFLGNKYTVFSQKQLQTGTTFRALVSINEGKVVLTPQSPDSNSVQKFSSVNADSLSNMASLFQEMGLKADTISMRIIQYFQSAGLTFNAKLATKARSIGLQFPGKEEEATEIALFLEQKGVHADADTVMEILGIVYGNSSHEKRGKKEENQNDAYAQIEFDESEDTIVEETTISTQSENMKNDFFQSLYTNIESAFEQKKGLLGFVNQHHVHPLHWIILPFEFGESTKKMNGTIRMLLNFDKKSTEKMVIYAFSYGKNYKVVVYCRDIGAKAQQQYEVQFCTEKEESLTSVKALAEMLGSCLPETVHCNVLYSNELALDGIFTIGSTISVVKLDA